MGLLLVDSMQFAASGHAEVIVASEVWVGLFASDFLWLPASVLLLGVAKLHSTVMKTVCICTVFSAERGANRYVRHGL